jgi:hypothetical protein
MKRSIFVGAAIGSIAIVLGTAKATMAESKNTHYSASFVVPTSQGPVTWTCTGEHVVNKGKIFEQEECTLSGATNAIKPGVYAGDPVGPFPGIVGSTQWYSDYNAVFAKTYSITINGSSTKAHVVSTY